MSAKVCTKQDYSHSHEIPPPADVRRYSLTSGIFRGTYGDMIPQIRNIIPLHAHIAL